MTLALNLRIVGAFLVLIGLSHAFLDRYFGWRQELEHVSLLTRQIFYVHTFFIGLAVTLAGAGSFAYADALTRRDVLSRAILTALLIFWICRLLVQFVGFDPAIWRGNRFRTFMHGFFSLFWCYVTATYGVALMKVWS
jgi:hypothetical protein